MWHFKTLCGTFWIVPDVSQEDKFFLGVDEDPLGYYSSYEAALGDINGHKTGYISWDMQPKMLVPSCIEAWMQGEPEVWV